MSFIVSNSFSFLHSCSWDMECLQLEMAKIYRVITQVPYINFPILGIIVFTKSVTSNFRAFWLAPVTRNILGYSLYCFAAGAKMASRLKTFSEDEICAILKMKQSYKQIPRKWRILSCWCLLVDRKLVSCWICDKIVKMHLTISPKFL